MFTSQARIDRKTGPDDLGRFEYLQALVTEFQDTDRQGAKEEILANLANFAYDPINYDHFRKLNVVDLFMGELQICIQWYKEIKQHIVDNGGLSLVINCLSSSNEETVLSAITTLMFLTTPQTQDEISSQEVVECMEKFAASSNSRLSNLARVFLQDYCKRTHSQEKRD
ncbi:PREDICTED: armadillo repeat-containing protein 7-like [Acropora digitifera]|uniref:armadillo repeat-containing protein 7-like n=1 Tax=Acropora digitifera TaxID=70779 RepID=UPI00077AD854|nr:PREDICTED: armadillo repeat-containing protein 7-like [Acropora digitifera]